jgi:hypothetical protein
MAYDRTLILVLYSPNDVPLNRQILLQEGRALANKTIISRFVKNVQHVCLLRDQDSLVPGDLGSLTLNSQLSLYGHWETVTIGGHAPQALAQYLYANGLRQAGNINLVACETSKNLGMFSNGSFAQEFLVEIRRVGDPKPTVLSVTGREGDVTIRAGEAYLPSTWGTKQVSGVHGDIAKGVNKKRFSWPAPITARSCVVEHR